MRVTVIVLMLAVPWPGAPGQADGAWLQISAGPAAISIRPLANGRRLIHLPDLTYRLEITARCPADFDPASLSISIADTRETLDAAQLGTVKVPAEITIPATQLAPFAVDRFCALGASERGSSLLVRDVVTAHLSLRCSGPGGDEVSYISRGLDLELNCATAPGDQGAAPASIER